MRLITVMMILGCLLPLKAVSGDVSCAKIHGGVTDAQKTEWGPSINRQLQGRLVRITQVFSFSDWVVVYVDARDADPAFLFFHGNPAKTSSVTMWSGAAAPTEQKVIEDWVLKNAPGIPHELAACFAWHVTRGRGITTDFGG